MKRGTVFLVSLAILALLLAACGTGSAPEPAAAAEAPREASAAPMAQGHSQAEPEQKNTSEKTQASSDKSAEKRQEEPSKRVVKIKEEWTGGLEKGRLSQRVEYNEAGSSVLELLYDKDGNLTNKFTEEYGADGSYVLMEYDGGGNLKSRQVSEKTDVGRRVSRYDGNGTLLYYYDAIAEKTDSGRVEKSIFYDTQGNVTSQIETKFNSDGKKIEYTDTGGQRSPRQDRYEYDPDGNLVLSVSSDGLVHEENVHTDNVHEYQYDSSGGMIVDKLTVGDSVTVERYENVYDNNGRIVEKRCIERLSYRDGVLHSMSGLSYGPNGVQIHDQYSATITAEVTGYDEYGSIIHTAKKDYKVPADVDGDPFDESNVKREYDIVDYRYEYWG